MGVFDEFAAGARRANPSLALAEQNIATSKARLRQYEAAEERAAAAEQRTQQEFPLILKKRKQELSGQNQDFEQQSKLLSEAARVGDIQKFNDVFGRMRELLGWEEGEVDPSQAMQTMANAPTPAGKQEHERGQERIKLMRQRRLDRESQNQARLDNIMKLGGEDPSIYDTQEAKDVFDTLRLPSPSSELRQTSQELIDRTPKGYRRSVTTGPQGRVTGSTLSSETKGQGQQKITVEEDGVNRIKLIDAQGNVIRDLGQAPKSAALVQIGMGGQPASPTERTALAKGRASIDALDNMKSLYDNARTKTGPIVGRTSPIAGLVGMTTDEQESFMAATSAFKNQVIKDITGAQMSEVEAQRIMKQIPDIIDPPARWLAKWQQTQKNLKDIQKRSEEVLRQSGIRVPEGAATQTSEQTKSMPDLKKEIKNMTDEQLQAIMDGTEPTEQPQPPLGGDAQQLPIASNIQGQKTAKLNPEANVTAIAKSLSPQLARIVDSFKPPIRSKIWRVLAKIPISEWQNLSDTEKEQIILKARRKSTGVTGKY